MSGEKSVIYYRLEVPIPLFESDERLAVKMIRYRLVVNVSYMAFSSCFIAKDV